LLARRAQRGLDTQDSRAACSHAGLPLYYESCLRVFLVSFQIKTQNFKPNPAEHKHAALDALPDGEIEFEPQLKHVLSVFAVTFDQEFAVQFVQPSPACAAVVLNVPATQAALCAAVDVIAPVSP